MSFEDAVTAKETKHTELKEAKATLSEFKKENKIKGEDAPEDEKLAKKFNKLVKAVETAQEDFDEAKALAKELKPAKERETKYEYPEGMDDPKEKKKFRAAQRSASKKEEKADKKADKKKGKEKEDDKKSDKKVKKSRKDDDD